MTQPGMYLRKDRVDYDALKAANYSTLKHFADSPLHYLHRLENPKPSTVPQLRGTITHTAILEPHRLASEYAVYEGDKKRGSKEWNEFASDNDGKKLVKLAEFEQAIRMRDAVRASKEAMKYLRKGTAESILVWDDAETGIRCKGRTDWISDEHAVVDIKGTANASLWTFSAECHKRQYHTQGAFYGDGYERLFPMFTATSVIIAVEYTEPHDVVVYRLPQEVIDVGRDAYRGYLRLLKDCRDSGYWPGRAGGSEMLLKLPAYAMPDEGDIESLGLEF